MSYNAKITNTGKYKNFYGWTIISELSSDMKIIENFIKNNQVLNKYFSALPSSSYHITLYNLWCNFSKLLHQQQKVIDDENCTDLKKQSLGIGFFNPKNCMNELFVEIKNSFSTNKWDNITLTIDEALFTGNTICLILKSSEEFYKMYKVRKTVEGICNRDDNMKCFHITLAYIYKNITKEEKENILKEVNILTMLLLNQTITLSNAGLYSFSSMESFQKYK
jgi:hypothetical protein